MSSYLLLGDRAYAQGIPDAQALVISDGRIAWIGDRGTALSFASDVDNVIEAQDSFIAPAFVDAHVHVSATGTQESNLDLSLATSFRHLASLVSEALATASASDCLFGHGWDDTSWPDTFEDFVGRLLPTPHDLYLSRIDAHSAIVKHTDFTAQAVVVSGAEHEDIRLKVFEQISPVQRQLHIETALRMAAAQGIVAVHENGGPAVSSREDFLNVLATGRRPDMPDVIGYWGDGNVHVALELGARGAAGDYSVDGSLGSKTAFLIDSYEASVNVHGNNYLDPRQIASHLIECTKAGIQGGFHVIGDGAIAQVRAGLELALETVTLSQLRACRHRLEHVEMPHSDDLAMFAQCGVVLSVQPVFDELWGADDGMYVQRLGHQRVESMNPFASMVNQGIAVAFGSDSPVTPLDPWRAIRAAINHHQPTSRISSRAAFSAHTRGGWRAARIDDAGILEVGAPAHIAMWSVKEYSVDVPIEQHSSWSTDPRSGTHALPDVRTHTPQCIATIKNGLPIFDRHSLFSNLSVD